MTSINLFSRKLKNELKRSLWVLSLGFLAFFFVFPVSSAILISKFSDMNAIYPVHERITDVYFSFNAFLTIIAVIAAIICGLSQFHYLHSKKQSDFYHSMPVTKKQLFLLKYITGFAIYLLCYLVNLILSMFIILIRGYFAADILGGALLAFAVNTVVFLLVYSVVVLSVILTGHMVISLCVIAGTFFYAPAIYMIVSSILEYFYQSYYSHFYEYMEKTKWFGLLPAIVQLDEAWHKDGPFVPMIFAMLIITLVVLVLSVVLYQRRPVESAGKAVAFKTAKFVLKALIVILCTFLGGLIFKEVAYGKHMMAWFIFGELTGFLISCCVLEIIYHFDIRAAFSNKGQMLILASFVAVATLILRFDLLRYDSYLPNETHVMSAALYITEVDNYSSFVISEDQFKYISTEEQCLENMELTDISSVLEIAKLGVMHNEDENNYKNVTIKYNMKSGREIYRTYYIPEDEYADTFAKLYASREYKEGRYSSYKLSNEYITDIRCQREFAMKNLKLSDAEKDNFMETYLRELAALDFDEYKTEAPLGILEFELGVNSSNYGHVTSMEIYPSFTDTIALIKSYGFELTKTMNVPNMESMTLFYGEGISKEYYEKYGHEGYEAAAEVDYGQRTVTITDKEQMKQIYDCLVEREATHSKPSLCEKLVNGLTVSVTFKVDGYGNMETYDYCVINENLPECILSIINR